MNLTPAKLAVTSGVQMLVTDQIIEVRNVM